MSLLRTFPLEVIESIVDISDVGEVKSFALTSKALLPHARTILHSTVTLCLSKNRDVPRFFLWLQEFPELKEFVRHLSLIDLRDAGDLRFPVKEQAHLVDILNQLSKHLRTVSIVHSHRHFACEWHYVPVSVRNALLECFSSKSLEAVDFQMSGDTSCLEVLTQCPKIKHLDVFQPLEMLSRPSRSTPRITLESLRFAFWDPPRNNADYVLGGDLVLDLSHLQKLVVDSMIWVNYSVGNWVARVATLCSSSLTELYWTVNTEDLVAREVTVSLQQLPQLRKLVLKCFDVRFKDTEQNANESCCSFISKLMKSRAPCPSVDSSVFILPWSSNAGPLCSLIASIQGTKCATFDFDPPALRMSKWQNNYGFIENAVDKREDLVVNVLRPLGAQDLFLDLRFRRPFTNKALDKLV